MAKVLIVEDEIQSREIMTRYLEVKGHRVSTAASAEEALVAANDTSFDFILMDVVLPGRCGLQVIPELRRLTTAPIIMMSGQSEEDVLPDAKILGANGFLPKPIDLSKMNALLENPELT
jgi:DNA-binding response OmpR family regulator